MLAQAALVTPFTTVLAKLEFQVYLLLEGLGQLTLPPEPAGGLDMGGTVGRFGGLPSSNANESLMPEEVMRLEVLVDNRIPSNCIQPSINVVDNLFWGP